MGLQGAVHPFKGTVPCQQRLGTEGFFGGTACQQNPDGDVVLFTQLLEGHGSARRGGGDPVVTAGMAQTVATFTVTGQGIVLGQKGHTGAFLAPAGSKRGVHTVPGTLHRKALFGHIGRQIIGGQLFFHTQFGMFIEIMGDLFQFGAQICLDLRDLLTIIHKMHHLFGFCS